jgi:hypothetical protein
MSPGTESGPAPILAAYQKWLVKESEIGRTSSAKRCNFANCAIEGKSLDISRLIIRGGPGTFIPMISAGTMTRDSPPPKFTVFPDLPTELQIKIWKCALPGPRIIQLHYLNGASFFGGARPPPILHTCRASREVALTVFERAFVRNDKPIYINFAHDTLHLATNPKMCEYAAGLYPDIKEKIQSLAVEISSQDDLEESVVDIGISQLSNLREIIFVVGGEIERMLAFKYAERVRFPEPEAMPLLWQRWKSWVELMYHFKGCVVRVVEAEIV